MTERGNKDKTALTIYVDPKIHMKFKIRCVENEESMTAVIEEFMKKYAEK